MNTLKTFLFSAVFFSLLMYSVSPTSESRQFNLGSKYSLAVRVAPSWQLDIKNKPRGDAEINVINSQIPKEKCRLYILPLDKIPDQDGIKALLKENGAALLKKAVEKEIRFVSLPDNRGQYYLLTDAAPKADEPRLIVRGASRSTHHLVLFTILFDDLNTEFFKTVINSIEHLRIDEKKDAN